MAERENVGADIHVAGLVQGVGYRYFTERAALRNGVVGWSKNLPDGRVMLDVEGDKVAIESFIRELEAGPSLARVDRVDVSWKQFRGRYDKFFIKF